MEIKNFFLSLVKIIIIKRRKHKIH